MQSEPRELTILLPDAYFTEISDFRERRHIGHRFTIEVYEDEAIWPALQRAVSLLPDEVISARIREMIADGNLELKFLANGKSREDWSGWDDSVDIDYLLQNDDGPVYVPSRPDLEWVASIRSIEEAKNAGLFSGQADQVIPFVSEGRGGGGEVWDLANWLLEQGVDVGWSMPRDAAILWIGRWTTRRVRHSWADRQARKVILDWQQRRIESPYQLRRFMDRKTAWTADEIGRRLRVPRNVASKLLKALGYEEDAGGSWRLGVSKKARKRRAKWTRAEEREMFGTS